MKAVDSSRFFIPIFKLTLAVAMAASLVVGCLPARWHRIQPGMSKDEVLHYVGEPRLRTYDDHFTTGNAETWFFDDYEKETRDFQPHKILFKNGRVTACEFDPSRVIEVKTRKETEKVVAVQKKSVPPDVGIRCDSNNDCLSGQCLNHQCAGPNLCTKLTGAECFADSDCCSLRCNFGTRSCY